MKSEKPRSNKQDWKTRLLDVNPYRNYRLWVDYWEDHTCIHYVGCTTVDYVGCGKTVDINSLSNNQTIAINSLENALSTQPTNPGSIL